MNYMNNTTTQKFQNYRKNFHYDNNKKTRVKKKIFLRLFPKINFFALFTKFSHKIHVVRENINKIKYYKNIYNKLYNQSKQEREK